MLGAVVSCQEKAVPGRGRARVYAAAQKCRIEGMGIGICHQRRIVYAIDQIHTGIAGVGTGRVTADTAPQQAGIAGRVAAIGSDIIAEDALHS